MSWYEDIIQEKLDLFWLFVDDFDDSESFELFGFFFF